MLTIFADSFRTATRQERWQGHPAEQPLPEQPASDGARDRRRLRRWMRDTGVL